MVRCHRCGMPARAEGRIEGVWLVYDGQCQCWNGYPSRERRTERCDACGTVFLFGVEHTCMFAIGDEVEVAKRGDANDGRAGWVGNVPDPQTVEVAFEDGMERASYRPEELRRVKVRVPAGMQNSARSRWEDFWNVS